MAPLTPAVATVEQSNGGRGAGVTGTTTATATTNRQRFNDINGDVMVAACSISAKDNDSTAA
eukprot:6540339-Karenia_brevis.AAC.1